MKKTERQRMMDRHSYSFQQYGYSPDALFWSSRGIQKTRFKVLSEIGIRSGDSLLDVGCGFGDLFSWLGGCDLAVDYTGIDLSLDILEKGRALNPDLALLHGELFDFDLADASFDWVVLSGTLNWDLHDDGAYARRVIVRMFKLCRDGVAFNMLNSRCFDGKISGNLLAYDPQVILAFCRQITENCQLRSDYLENDFTIYMKR